MPSLPASQPAEDGRRPSSEEPPVTHGGARKSVGPPPTGAASNELYIVDVEYILGI